MSTTEQRGTISYHMKDSKNGIAKTNTNQEIKIKNTSLNYLWLNNVETALSK